MYCGLDKSGGGLVGSADSHQISVEFNEVSETTSAEEILICEEITENDEIRKVYAQAKLNPNDGTLIWTKSYDEKVILNRTIGMSQMTSMLHDTDRNSVYERAISRIITNFIEKYQRNPTVLDIGTGTGLLSMMCVRYGAEFVIGCEMFEAMADVARLVVEQNGLSNKILIVTAKSCDIDSLPFSPDIIISELLDSALLGEGVLCSHRDAIDRFLDRSLPDDNISERIIPHAATVYGTLIQSVDLFNLSAISNSLAFEGLSSTRKTNWSHANEPEPPCQWSKMIPVHWMERFEHHPGTVKLTEPTPLMNVEFFHGSISEEEHQHQQHQPAASSPIFQTRMTILQDGVVHGLLCWWNLNLIPSSLHEPSEEFLFAYSTAPGAQRWQDHWQQVVIPFPGPGISCYKGDILVISTVHDDLRIWCQVESLQRGDLILQPPNWIECLDIEENSKKKQKLDLIPTSPPPPPPPPPECSCGWHILCSPDRLLALNDTKIMSKWQLGIQNILTQINDLNTTYTGPAVVCDLSDGSTLAFMMASQLLKSQENSQNSRIQIISVERKQFSALFSSQLVQSNEGAIPEDQLAIWSEDEWKDALNADPSKGLFVQYLEDLQSSSSLQSSLTPSTPSVIVLLSECFYHQMHSQPIMSALSFYYSVHEVVAQNYSIETSSILLVAPLRARVMTAGFQLHDLIISHGDAGVVSGFDHSSLDEVQQYWSDNWFPYKLGNYRKTLLTAPVCITTIDYDLAIKKNSQRKESENENENEKRMEREVRIPVVATGRLDCMAVWVEYDISETARTDYWDDGNFPFYLTTLTKFFPESINVTTGTGEGEGAVTILCQSSFSFGESEIDIQYSVEKMR